jgi:hypothetical protein
VSLQPDRAVGHSYRVRVRHDLTSVLEGGSERLAGAAAGSMPGHAGCSFAPRARRLEPAGERQRGDTFARALAPVNHGPIR